MNSFEILVVIFLFLPPKAIEKGMGGVFLLGFAQQKNTKVLCWGSLAAPT